MVRRHRISEEEVRPMMRAVHRALSEMVGAEQLPEDAYNLFTLLWRFKEHRSGPPHYPEATRETIASLLLETAYLFG